MTFYKGGSVRKALTFNAQHSNFEKWFEQGKMTSSPWSDLASASDISYFSLKGHCQGAPHICESFQITRSKKGPGCDDVFGWMYRGTHTNCNWEVATLNAIAYCKGATSCQFSKQGKF